MARQPLHTRPVDDPTAANNDAPAKAPQKVKSSLPRASPPAMRGGAKRATSARYALVDPLTAHKEKRER